MCFGGREDVEAKKSREIDALIHRDEKVLQKVVKLLLLGERNSGYRETQYRITNH
jgi:guanine nucleotide-binding protein subunit alpha